MYLLACPDCQTENSVTPAQAGDEITCSKCGAVVAVPRLGDLKKLPRRDEGERETPPAVETRSVGGTIAFVVLSLIAVAALLVASYSGLRWAMIDVDVTTESHIAEMKEDFKTIDPAVVVREYQDMETYSLDLVMPYKYQKVADEKAQWGRNTLIASVLTLVCGAGGLIAASRGREPENK
jgi:hypothetical protein